MQEQRIRQLGRVFDFGHFERPGAGRTGGRPIRWMEAEWALGAAGRIVREIHVVRCIIRWAEKRRMACVL
jgi:hypothetical protein